MAIARAGAAVDLGLQNPISGSTYSVTFSLDAAADFLLIGLFGDSNDTFDGATKPTWNGVTMTLIGKKNAIGGGDRWVYLWFLAGPATGSHTFVATSTVASVVGHAVAQGYSGAKQTGQPDSSVVNEDDTVSGTMTATTTVVAANCWLFLVERHNTSVDSTAGAGANLLLATGTGLAIFDSNGTVATGARTMVVNNSATPYFAWCIASIAEATGGGATAIDAADTVKVQVTDTAFVLGMPVATDTAKVQVAEQSFPTVIVPSSESLKVQLSEQSFPLVMPDVADSLRVQLSESVIGNASGSASDACAVVIAESMDVFVRTDNPDTCKVVIGETSSIAAIIAASETLKVQLSEASAILGLPDVVDNLAVHVSESVALQASVSPADAAAVVIGENMAVMVIADVADAVRIQAGEASFVSVIIAASEALRLGLTEVTALMVMADVSEVCVIACTDRVDGLASTFATDTVAVHLGEQSFVFVSVAALAEALGVRLAEAALIANSLAAADTLAVVLGEVTVLDMTTVDDGTTPTPETPLPSAGGTSNTMNVPDLLFKSGLYTVRRKIDRGGRGKW